MLLPARTPDHSAQHRSHFLTSHAGAWLRTAAPLIDRADRRCPISARSRSLCAALGVLAEEAYLALGGAKHRDTVGYTAALLSLLTKVDDEVIDARSFHGGPLRTRGHAAVRKRTRAYLQPTLESLRAGVATHGEGRCELAARVGRSLRSLCKDDARLDDLLDVIARGWEVQVRAVDILSRHPGETSSLDVARITSEISGYWLGMITMIGGVPSDAARPLSRLEQRAFLDWGWHIQRADALADFGKDVDSGLANSWAGRVVFDRVGAPYVHALKSGDRDRLYAMLHGSQADLACTPRSPDALDRAAAKLATLGAVPQWLRWIHGMLIARYAEHPAVAHRAPSLRVWTVDLGGA